MIPSKSVMMYCQLDQHTKRSNMTLYSGDWNVLEDIHVCDSSISILEELRFLSPCVAPQIDTGLGFEKKLIFDRNRNINLQHLLRSGWVPLILDSMVFQGGHSGT